MLFGAALLSFTVMSAFMQMFCFYAGFRMFLSFPLIFLDGF